MRRQHRDHTSAYHISQGVAQHVPGMQMHRCIGGGNRANQKRCVGVAIQAQGGQQLDRDVLPELGRKIVWQMEVFTLHTHWGRYLAAKRCCSRTGSALRLKSDPSQGLVLVQPLSRSISQSAPTAGTGTPPSSLGGRATTIRAPDQAGHTNGQWDRATGDQWSGR